MVSCGNDTQNRIRSLIERMVTIGLCQSVNRLLDRLHIFILKIAAALALSMLVIDAMGLAAQGGGADGKRVTTVSQSTSPFTGTITSTFYLPVVRQPRPPMPPIATAADYLHQH
jgi:hypothetical protein